MTKIAIADERTAPYPNRQVLYFIEASANELSAPDQNGNNALHRACIRNNLADVKALLPYVDINTSNENRENALSLSFHHGMLAAKAKQESVFDLLTSQPGICISNVLPLLRTYASSPYCIMMMEKLLATPHINLPVDLIPYFCSGNEVTSLQGIRLLLQYPRFVLGNSLSHACAQYASIVDKSPLSDSDFIKDVISSIALLFIAHNDRHQPLPEDMNTSCRPLSEWMAISESNERITFIREKNPEVTRYYDDVIAPAYHAARQNQSPSPLPQTSAIHMAEHGRSYLRIT